MARMTYNRSRYYAQSTTSMLNDSREALGQTQDKLKEAEEQAKHWKRVAKWFATQYATANNITIDQALEEYYDDMEKTV